MSKKHIVTTAVVVLVLAALIYFQVQHWRKFDWGKFRHTTGQVEMLHIIAAVALVYLTYLLRAVRWKVFLKPICDASTRDIIGPTFIGFTGLALLGRPGEFIRPYLIARKEGTPFLSQIGVWAVERIFDIGAFTVLMTVTVFLPGAIQSNPYITKFREAAVALCILVAAAGAFCYAIRTRGPKVGAFLHRMTAPISLKLAHHLDQKTRAFGTGLNTIKDRQSFLQLVAISLLIWVVIAFSYREVTHAYPPEHGYRQARALGEIPGPPAVDVETATLAGMPEMAGQPLDESVIEELRPALERKGFRVERRPPPLHGFWLVNKSGHHLKRIGDRPHLTDMDLSHVLLLMGFSMVGSIVQLPAVGGGSQLAVISALQLIYGIPPETAVSCGIMLWVVTFMACIPVGLILAHREHVSLRKLSHEAQEEERIEESAAESTP
ncbi:MAG: lysylphosphatidylglycerol synthase transmembrane domain-containing protein [Terriglobales bacterium]